MHLGFPLVSSELSTSQQYAVQIHIQTHHKGAKKYPCKGKVQHQGVKNEYTTHPKGERHNNNAMETSNITGLGHWVLDSNIS